MAFCVAIYKYPSNEKKKEEKKKQKFFQGIETANERNAKTNALLSNESNEFPVFLAPRMYINVNVRDFD